MIRVKHIRWLLNRFSVLMRSMDEIVDTIFLVLLYLSSIRPTSAGLTETCIYPPCKYNVYRENVDNANVIVNDASVHVITWNWEVKGGQWNVTYRLKYPDGWYEGLATFINCTNILNGREQPFVSWGSSKGWESNAKLIYANDWNITYNGDVFGFIPTENGKYIFRVFTKNKRHNPFASELSALTSSPCLLQSSDEREIKIWWTESKKLQNCPELTLVWNHAGNTGSWNIIYKWVMESDKIWSSVYYKQNGKIEVNIINWVLDLRENLVSYRTNPVKIVNEPAWSFDLSPSEKWGFSPTSKEKWVFQHFSTLIMKPTNFKILA